MLNFTNNSLLMHVKISINTKGAKARSVSSKYWKSKVKSFEQEATGESLTRQRSGPEFEILMFS